MNTQAITSANPFDFTPSATDHDELCETLATQPHQHSVAQQVGIYYQLRAEGHDHDEATVLVLQASRFSWVDGEGTPHLPSVPELKARQAIWVSQWA